MFLRKCCPQSDACVETVRRDSCRLALEARIPYRTRGKCHAAGLVGVSSEWNMRNLVVMLSETSAALGTFPPVLFQLPPVAQPCANRPLDRFVVTHLPSAIQADPALKVVAHVTVSPPRAIKSFEKFHVVAFPQCGHFFLNWLRHICFASSRSFTASACAGVPSLELASMCSAIM